MTGPITYERLKEILQKQEENHKLKRSKWNLPNRISIKDTNRSHSQEQEVSPVDKIKFFFSSEKDGKKRLGRVEVRERKSRKTLERGFEIDYDSPPPDFGTWSTAVLAEIAIDGALKLHDKL